MSRDPNPLRDKIGAAVLVLVLVASVATVAFYLFRGQKRVQRLYDPKLLMLRVDEVPSPKGSKLPIEVMDGTRVTVACENVPPPRDAGRPAYRFRLGSRVVESATCSADFPIQGPLGSTQPVKVEYLLAPADGASRVVDRWDAMIRIARGGEYLRIRALEAGDAGPVGDLMVPGAVVPYVEAALALNGDPESYAVLFFVTEFGKDQPILQVAGNPRAKQKIEPIAAPLKRYRRFGHKIDGCAAWPSEPLQVGGAADQRKVFEIYAAIFRKGEVAAVADRFVGFDGVADDGQARVKVYPKRLDDVRALAWRGWMSEPIRVVRAADTSPDRAR